MALLRSTAGMLTSWETQQSSFHPMDIPLSSSLLVGFFVYFSLPFHLSWGKGGKGVATASGVFSFFLDTFLLATSWRSLRDRQTASVASLLTIITLLYFFFANTSPLIFGISILIFVRHKDNIVRLAPKKNFILEKDPLLKISIPGCIHMNQLENKPLFCCWRSVAVRKHFNHSHKVFSSPDHFFDLWTRFFTPREVFFDSLFGCIWCLWWISYPSAP